MKGSTGTARDIGAAPHVPLRVDDVSKRYVGRNASVLAVDHVTLAFDQPGFFTVLGPSGCGKSTLLRLIAGLEQPDHGGISIAGRSVVDTRSGAWVPPQKRRVGVVFQSYALWPHMTVFDNVAYPLRSNGTTRADIRRRVDRTLELVRLEGLRDRKPSQLSGGQQQRVAVARAIVAEPEVLLLDEPLSNLDAKLRSELQQELRELHERVETTIVHVTHDQHEALSLSDTLVLMRDGRVVQCGAPRDVYRRPDCRFAAEFLGTVNVLNVLHAPAQGSATIDTAIGSLGFDGHVEHVDDQSTLCALVRPENVALDTTPPSRPNGVNVMKGRVHDVVFHGASVDVTIQVGPSRLLARMNPTTVPSHESEVWLTVRPDDIRVVPDTGAA